MDILNLKNKLSDSICDLILIYKEKSQHQIKKSQMGFVATHFTVTDYDLANKVYVEFKHQYRSPFFIDRMSSCNYFSIIELQQYNYINTWNAFDQIQGKPSTLTFISKITDSPEPCSIEFIKDGRVDLEYKSVLIFPSCFTFSWRVNPIKSKTDTLIVGSILFEK